ncbi:MULTISPECIES: hypothetical protein [Burkholderia]|uniref:hypothetical protein n=1 Tax=Burkholderia TaxID=32008 RepID=UPI00117F2AE1|nr:MULTISPECIES: hypothetical protein [Burkholderia]
MKKLLSSAIKTGLVLAFPLLWTSAAYSQFVSGQVLTAAQLNQAFSNVLPRSGGALTGPLTVPTLTSPNVAITGGTIAGLSSPLPVGSGGTGATAATGSGSVVLSTSPTIASTYNNPFTVNGLQSINDVGRSNNDNTPTINLNISESLNYTQSYATHYGFFLNATQLSGGTGDRIGMAAIQTCNATLANKSCVGISGLAVAGGSGAGNYTGMNPRALVPAGLTGTVGAAVGGEADVETHGPVAIRNGWRIAGENLSGGATTHGTIEDAALAIVVDSGNTADGFQVGIQFGENPQGYPQNWPITSGGTLLQASNPNVSLAYGFDLSGSTAGFTKQAIALPQNTPGGGIQWGTAGTAGKITSSATTTGGFIHFTDTGVQINNASDGSLLNVGGSTGSDVVNNGYMIQASLTGYVYCNGSGGRCTASNTIQLPVTTVATLPTCGASQRGLMYAVSDATAPTYNGNLTGGGSVSIPVYCNGSSWTAH